MENYSSYSISEALLKEFSSVGAEHLIDTSLISHNYIRIFNHKFKIVYIPSLKTKDADNIIAALLPENERNSLVLFVSKLSKQTDKVLRRNHVNFCDANGNLLIQIGGMSFSNVNDHIDDNDHRQKNLLSLSTVKLIFCLIHYNDSANWPMRKLSEYAGISLGSVQRAFELLRLNGFIFITDNGRFIKNKMRLLDVWVEGFNSILAPKILLGYALFKSPQMKSSWTNLNLPSGSFWGGEAAAQFYQGYLKAEYISIFSDENYRSLLKDLNLLPVNRGDVAIFKKFWKDDNEISGHLAPLSIVYAQLMGSSDSRCIDAARRILNLMNYDN